MPGPLTLTDYAVRRGVSPAAVSKAVRTGRLSASVVRDGRGVPAIADPELADREWEANTRPSLGGAALRADLASAPTPRPPAKLLETASVASDGVMVDCPPVAAHGTAGLWSRDGADPSPREGDMAHEHLPHGIPPLAVSLARKAAADALIKEGRAELVAIEVARARGQLVPADDARADVQQRYSLVKTRLLGVAAAVAQELPELAVQVVPVVDRLVRRALEELAG